MRGCTRALIAGSLMLTAPLAWSLPSGVLPTPSTPGTSAGTSQGAAHDAAAVAVYNSGVALLKQADQLAATAAGQTDSARAKTEKSAHAAYTEARAKFQEATQRDPSLPEAWNNLGYARRQLGDYESALAAYARALALRPDYPEALEYRGEAYLRMNRIDDAKQAYMDLFVTNRAVAKHFLTSMQSWITEQKSKPGANDGALADLEKWVQERSQIDAQTAALTRAGTAASWR